MKILSLALAATLLTGMTLLHAEDSPLEGQMKILAKDTKQLSQQIADSSQQQANIDLIEKIRSAVLEAKKLNPRKTASIPATDQAKFIADYQAQMDKLSDAYAQMEIALKAGNYEEARNLLSTVGSLKKEGHKKFKQD